MDRQWTDQVTELSLRFSHIASQVFGVFYVGYLPSYWVRQPCICQSLSELVITKLVIASKHKTKHLWPFCTIILCTLLATLYNEATVESFSFCCLQTYILYVSYVSYVSCCFDTESLRKNHIHEVCEVCEVSAFCPAVLMLRQIRLRALAPALPDGAPSGTNGLHWFQLDVKDRFNMDLYGAKGNANEQTSFISSDIQHFPILLVLLRVECAWKNWDGMATLSVLGFTGIGFRIKDIYFLWYLLIPVASVQVALALLH